VGLIKTRPQIQLLLPSHAYPGDRVIATVRLDAKRQIPIESLTCELVGHEAVTVAGSSSGSSQRRSLCAFEARLLDKHTIAAGRHEHACAFELPADLPPSYQSASKLDATQVEYVVTVRCAIPWWPDAVKEFLLQVQLPPQTVDDAGPTIHTSRLGGPSGNEPHIEFSLIRGHHAPGETLRGELALSNVDGNRYKTATFAIAAYEQRFHHQRGRAVSAKRRWGDLTEMKRYAMQIDVSQAAEGQAIPFAMKLPGHLSATHESTLWALSWMFEVKLAIGWGNELVARAPITILPRGSKRRSKQRRAIPIIGSQRLATLWTNVAHGAGLRFDGEQRRMIGELGGVSIALTREHRGADGIFLGAELSYPRLGLGLDGGLASGLRRMVGGGVSLGDAAWDKRHYLSGREPAQIEHFAAALAVYLTPLIVDDIDDEHAVVSRRGAGQSRKQLLGFATAVAALANALHAALEQVPPPAQLEGHIRPWQRLAKRMGGKLRTTDMSVRGRWQGASAEVATVWTPSGKACHTAFVIAGPDIAAESSVLAWADGYTRGEPTRLSKGARGKLETMFPDALSITIETDEVVLWDARAPITDHAVLTSRLDQLTALAAALQGHGGPYR